MTAKINCLEVYLTHIKSTILFYLTRYEKNILPRLRQVRNNYKKNKKSEQEEKKNKITKIKRILPIIYITLNGQHNLQTIWDSLAWNAG